MILYLKKKKIILRKKIKAFSLYFYKELYKALAICHANTGGTALPTCLYASDAEQTNLKLSGND